MKTIESRLEIQFSQDRKTWREGLAQGGDLFFRTRSVISGVPTRWKAYCLPAYFIGVPIPVVWHMLKDMPEKPITVEEYDTMCAVADAIGKLVEER